MSLLSDIEAAEAEARKGPPCTVAVILDDLPPEDADALRRALITKKARHISVGLAANGIAIAAQTIQRHKRGDCSCR